MILDVGGIVGERVTTQIISVGVSLSVETRKKQCAPSSPICYRDWLQVSHFPLEIEHIGLLFLSKYSL